MIQRLSRTRLHSSCNPNTDNDPADVAPIANGPAFGKDSSNNKSSANNDPAAVIQNPANDPADGSGSQSVALSVTTIAGHNIQIPASQPSVGVILVDGQSITAEADPKVVSNTRIALDTNGDLILSTSTVHNILPSNPPALEQAPFVTSINGHSIQISPSQPISAQRSPR